MVKSFNLKRHFHRTKKVLCQKSFPSAMSNQKHYSKRPRSKHSDFGAFHNRSILRVSKRFGFRTTSENQNHFAWISDVWYVDLEWLIPNEQFGFRTTLKQMVRYQLSKPNKTSSKPVLFVFRTYLYSTTSYFRIFVRFVWISDVW